MENRDNGGAAGSIHSGITSMKKNLFLLGMIMIALSGLHAEETLRPPAVPLVVCDPYFSIWSCADTLHGDVTRHWTKRPHPLTGLIRIDGETRRLMGDQPADVKPLPQLEVKVFPCRTLYRFAGLGIEVTLTFLQAALPDDIDLLSRPVVHVTWDCRSTDGKTHEVQVLLDAAQDLVVNHPDQEVVWEEPPAEGMAVLRAGARDQRVLATRGDNVRIDWGYFYLAADRKYEPVTAMAKAEACRKRFIEDGGLPERREAWEPRTVKAGAPVLAVTFDLGAVSEATRRVRAQLAYDDLYSILYFERRLRPYWNRNGLGADGLLRESLRDADAIESRVIAFDDRLMADLRAAGGEKYALMAALAYRQCIGANKIAADKNGMPLVFPKENNSNGCIATVDVFYPMAPLFLLLNPTLARGSFNPILDYAASDYWSFPFAPHDLGTYPQALGQVYGGGEDSEANQMPVEECGNMLLLVAAATRADGDLAMVRKYWPLLTKWAEYLESKGLDPEHQLCTDDFAGRLAHNVNLSAKAILGMAAYADLAKRLGHDGIASRYRTACEKYAVEWAKRAHDGDHYRLAFDKSGTWSQKYNLVWDRLLDLNLFDPAVAATEMAHYRKVQQRYGLALDNRKPYAKLDWIFWTGSITGKRGDFEALTDPVFAFLNESPSRNPMTDWYWVESGKMVAMYARPVVGGVFIRMLDDDERWKAWVDRAEKPEGDWAPLPRRAVINPVVPTAKEGKITWNYTTEAPPEGWEKPGFDTSGWKEGQAGFGNPDTPGSVVNTKWFTKDIWLRRTFALPKADPATLELLMSHDEDAEIYINGVLAAKVTGYTTKYIAIPLSDAARKALKPGDNTLAVHCRQTLGGQYIDVGFCEVIREED